MHDIRLIRAEPDAFDAALARRGIPPRSKDILLLDSSRNDAKIALQDMQTQRNALSKIIGEGKRRGVDTSDNEAKAVRLRQEIAMKEHDDSAYDRAIFDILSELPNRLDDDVPDGPDESANVVVHQVGQAVELPFPALQHFELGEGLGMMDFELASKIAGARFTILRGGLARMERALGQFMLDLHTQQHGYEETAVPVLVNDATMFGTGQLPKFAEDSFRTTDGRWLIATSEIPLTNAVRDTIVPEARLPIRMTALTNCFRSEAGSAGRDTRGMLRQHQFQKVEMVSVVHPDQSVAEQERMTACAEKVLALLGLPYRRVKLSSGDTGFGAARTFDLEVWLPGQKAWREISSCSNTRDFQARRMNARFRAADGKTMGFLHTLNGSGVAVGRCLIAVMENHQQADGSIRVPEVLRPYLGGLESIAKA